MNNQQIRRDAAIEAVRKMALEIMAELQARQHGREVAAGKARARQRRLEHAATETGSQSAGKDGTP
jgi:hypothetical protein